MSGTTMPSMETDDFVIVSHFHNGNNGNELIAHQTSTTSQTSDSSSSTTPSSTPTLSGQMTNQELSASILESSLPETTAEQSPRGRTRQKRRNSSKRYFTPPSRLPSPPRPDFFLEVETMPQDPDIFADAETDYFSSAERNEGPRAFRRRFFDAMPSIDSQTTLNLTAAVLSIDAQLAAVAAGRS